MTGHRRVVPDFLFIKHNKMKNKKLNKPLKMEDKNHQKKISWAELSNKQKAQLLIGSTRFSDDDNFLKEFKSWEQPETV